MDRAEAASLASKITRNIMPGERTNKGIGGMVDAGSTDAEERQEERAGAVERHRRVRRTRHGVPDWARPSQEELENIVRGQVCIICIFSVRAKSRR